MQIISDNGYVTDKEYRDDDGNPVNGSIIIADDSKDALLIKDGCEFTFRDGKLKVHKKGQKIKRINPDKKKRDKKLGIYKKLKKGEATVEEMQEVLLELMKKDYEPLDTDEENQ